MMIWICWYIICNITSSFTGKVTSYSQNIYRFSSKLGFVYQCGLLVLTFPLLLPPDLVTFCLALSSSFSFCFCFSFLFFSFFSLCVLWYDSFCHMISPFQLFVTLNVSPTHKPTLWCSLIHLLSSNSLEIFLLDNFLNIIKTWLYVSVQYNS